MSKYEFIKFMYGRKRYDDAKLVEFVDSGVIDKTQFWQITDKTYVEVTSA